MLSLGTLRGNEGGGDRPPWILPGARFDTASGLPPVKLRARLTILVVVAPDALLPYYAGLAKAP